MAKYIPLFEARTHVTHAFVDRVRARAESWIRAYLHVRVSSGRTPLEGLNFFATFYITIILDYKIINIILPINIINNKLFIINQLTNCNKFF